MAISLDDLTADTSFTQHVKGQVTFLPEPERADRWTPMISVDDHIVEPPGAFADRFPAKYAEDAPRVVALDDGSETWMYAGHSLPNVGFNAVVGRPVSEYSFEP
ncbi:MAG: amidohydrolase, partial [bacterium]|nr:amidohydrolase [bacterium]